MWGGAMKKILGFRPVSSGGEESRSRSESGGGGALSFEDVEKIRRACTSEYLGSLTKCSGQLKHVYHLPYTSPTGRPLALVTSQEQKEKSAELIEKEYVMLKELKDKGVSTVPIYSDVLILPDGRKGFVTEFIEHAAEIDMKVFGSLHEGSDLAFRIIEAQQMGDVDFKVDTSEFGLIKTMSNINKLDPKIKRERLPMPYINRMVQDLNSILEYKGSIEDLQLLVSRERIYVIDPIDVSTATISRTETSDISTRKMRELGIAQSKRMVRELIEKFRARSRSRDGSLGMELLPSGGSPGMDRGRSPIGSVGRYSPKDSSAGAIGGSLAFEFGGRSPGAAGGGAAVGGSPGMGRVWKHSPGAVRVPSRLSQQASPIEVDHKE